jgi:hypothetical protein
VLLYDCSSIIRTAFMIVNNSSIIGKNTLKISSSRNTPPTGLPFCGEVVRVERWCV